MRLLNGGRLPDFLFFLGCKVLLVVVDEFKLFLVEFANHLLIPALNLIATSDDVTKNESVSSVTHDKAHLIKVITASDLLHNDLLVHSVNALINAFCTATLLLLFHKRDADIKND